MRTFWKVFAALALMLPLGAFVAGTLVASAAEEPRERDTLIIQQGDPTGSSSPEPEDDTPGVDVVTPSPDEVHDDGDDDLGDDHGGDRPDGASDDGSDHSGPGGGDDGSGHGGGHSSGHSGGGSSGGSSGGGDDHSGHGGDDD